MRSICVYVCVFQRSCTYARVCMCVCGRMYRFDALGNEPVFDAPVFPSSVILTKPSSSAVCDLWNDETD